MDKYAHAFPLHVGRDEKSDTFPETHLGLSKRELFAAMMKPPIDGYSVEFISSVLGTEPPPPGIERVLWITGFEADMKVAEAEALICALDKRKSLEYIPSDLHPENWWTDRSGEILCDPIGDRKVGRLYMMRHDDDVQARGERMIACVKAMEGIDNPEAWREQLIELMHAKMYDGSRGGKAFNSGIEQCIHLIENFGKK